MNVSVFGLGYVGCITAAGFARLGHRVTGVDVSDRKVDDVSRGAAPVAEPGLAAALAAAHRAGLLVATMDADSAVRDAQLTMICVGTPSRADGRPDLGALERVASQIGRSLAARPPARHVVVVRSTTTPGTIERIVRPRVLAELPDERHGDIAFLANPEFLREGCALRDFDAPPFVLVGGTGWGTDVIGDLYAGLEAPIIITGLREAEILKLASNAFHALKIVFANEMGNLCSELGVDGRRVMEVFCQDRKLNISPAYLRPGFAFGGSCLPKDVRALLALGRQAGIEMPVVDAIEWSNEIQIRRAVRRIEMTGRRRVALLGLSFKRGTDDLRESPYVALAEILLGKGYELTIYDPGINLHSLVGANRAFIERAIPHIARLLTPTAEEAVARGDVAVVAYPHAEFAVALASAAPPPSVVDLAECQLLGAEQDRLPLWSNARLVGAI